MPDKLSSKLVLGRAGELAVETDEQTFALIRDIFSYDGPYRKVLRQFGIGSTYKEDFVVYKDNKVYTDIDIENAVLWHTCLAKLIINDGKAELVSDYSLKALRKGGYGFLKKFLKELEILLNLKKYEEVCDFKYKSYSTTLIDGIQSGKIHRKDFLIAFEDVVYVTYIYELLYNFNRSNDFSSSCLTSYINDNDYLLSFDETYAEVKLRLGSGFSINDNDTFKDFLRKTNITELIFIPDQISLPDCDLPYKKSLEIKLQCMKNNMRLKTDLLAKLI